MSLGLIINAWQEAHLRWTRDRFGVNWEEFVHCQVRANETYSEAKRQFSARNRNVLMNAQSPHKWWSTLKSAVFGLSKADLLSDHFDGKQSISKTHLLCLQVE